MPSRQETPLRPESCSMKRACVSWAPRLSTVRSRPQTERARRLHAVDHRKDHGVPSPIKHCGSRCVQRGGTPILRLEAGASVPTSGPAFGPPADRPRTVHAQSEITARSRPRHREPQGHGSAGAESSYTTLVVRWLGTELGCVRCRSRTVHAPSSAPRGARTFRDRCPPCCAIRQGTRRC